MIEIDARVRPLVECLNDLPAVSTFSSCGGHANPDRSQVPEGHFQVSLIVEDLGSLEVIVRACDSFTFDGPTDQGEAKVKAWYDGGLNFDLSGRGDPARLARLIQTFRPGSGHAA